MVTIKCKSCGREFYAYPSRAKEAKFCSHGCWGIYLSNDRLSVKEREVVKKLKREYGLMKYERQLYEEGLDPFERRNFI